MIAIIPAGGKAVRFNGTQKELLPIAEGKTLLENSLDTAQRLGADDIIIITNHTKVATQMRIIEQTQHRPIYIYQDGDELHEALLAALHFVREDALLLFPDTLFDIDLELNAYQPLNKVLNRSCINFGTFATKTPARYSVFFDNEIITKPPIMSTNNEVYSAYGAIQWPYFITSYFLRHKAKYAHYDAMFNDAIHNFCKSTFEIKNYQDLGTFNAYKTYITNLKKEEKPNETG